MNGLREKIIISKVARLSVIINAVQIVFMLGIALAVAFGDSVVISNYYVKAIVVLAACVVSWGAAVDIREALMTSRTASRLDMVKSALTQLEKLNVTLRGQRHDFMNHLQVVYSLMELEDYAEAMKYIERTYGDILSVSKIMKTSSPAINALLMAKTGDANANKIDLQLKISSPYSDLPMESWEMCRVLGNLLDNAIDALEGVANPRIEVELTEDMHNYGFRVFNNGPAIKPEHRELIFQTGFTTKSTGTGMGLHIVRSILREHGGDVTLKTGGEGTAFIGAIPKRPSAEMAAYSGDAQE